MCNNSSCGNGYHYQVKKRFLIAYLHPYLEPIFICKRMQASQTRLAHSKNYICIEVLVVYINNNKSTWSEILFAYIIMLLFILITASMYCQIMQCNKFILS